MLQLRYEEQGTTKTHRLKQGMTLVGRLPTCDLVLTDPSVSRHHASFKVIDTECRIQDAASRFGTFLNDERVTQELAVAPGDTVRLGEVSLRRRKSAAQPATRTDEGRLSRALLSCISVLIHDRQEVPSCVSNTCSRPLHRWSR